jgi:hypothetical protein
MFQQALCKVTFYENGCWDWLGNTASTEYCKTHTINKIHYSWNVRLDGIKGKLVGKLVCSNRLYVKQLYLSYLIVL